MVRRRTSENDNDELFLEKQVVIFDREATPPDTGSADALLLEKQEVFIDEPFRQRQQQQNSLTENIDTDSNNNDNDDAFFEQLQPPPNELYPAQLMHTLQHEDEEQRSVISNHTQSQHSSPSPSTAESEQYRSQDGLLRQGDDDGDEDQRSRRSSQQQLHLEDMEKTGTWGEITKIEKAIILLLVMASIGIIGFAIVKLKGKGKQQHQTSSLNSKSPTSPSYDPPTITFITYDEQLTLLLSELESNPFTNQTVYSRDIDYYHDLRDDNTSAPSDRAISYILFVNFGGNGEDLDSAWLIRRYALAVLYFAWNGDGWSDSTNWFSILKVCEWYGITCDQSFRHIRDINLAANQLQGTIPPEINLLGGDLYYLTLGHNQLYGEVPWLALGSMPNLITLKLNNNDLQGGVSFDVRSNGKLDTMFLQRNNFTGEWDNGKFCPGAGLFRTNQFFEEYYLDCDKLTNCSCCRAYCNPDEDVSCQLSSSEFTRFEDICW